METENKCDAISNGSFRIRPVDGTRDFIKQCHYLTSPFVKTLAWVQIILGILTNIFQVGLFSIGYFNAQGIFRTEDLYGCGSIVAGFQIIGASFTILAYHEPTYYWLHMGMAFQVIGTMGHNVLVLYLAWFTIPELRRQLNWNSHHDLEMANFSADTVYWVLGLTIQLVCCSFASIPIGTALSLALGQPVVCGPAIKRKNSLVKSDCTSKFGKISGTAQQQNASVMFKDERTAAM